MLSSNYLSQIYNTLNSTDVPIKQIELEAKFGYYRRKKAREGHDFVSDVGWRKFKALEKELMKGGLVPIQQHITDYKSDLGIRKQIIIVNEHETVLWQRKTKLRNFSRGPAFDYGVRVTISQETEIDEVIGFKHDKIRIKNRKSYNYNDFLRIDMSEVTTNDSDKVTYEVEVEILKLYEGDLRTKFIEFNQLLYLVFQFLYDTAYIYTKRERENLAKYINNKLGEKRSTLLQYSMVANARNLKFRDMVWGGLIGNKLNGEQNRYSVTHKADGLRKFLVIDRTGIWFVYPKLEFNLVYRFDRANHDESLNGLILDGELVPKDDAHRRVRDLMGRLEAVSDIPGIETFDKVQRERLKFVPEADYWFLVFDTLAIGGNKSIQYEPHAKRMEAAYQTVNKINNITDNKRLVIHFKSFRQITSPEQFFPLMQSMFAEKNLLPYEDDGFIFTPELAPYNPIRKAESDMRRQFKLKERTLVRQSDICKWKPTTRLTIDFSIKHRLDGKIDLLVYAGWGKLIPFKGSFYDPFDPETMVDYEHPIIAEHPTGAVIEFAWDKTKNVFIPIRSRPDKMNPNAWDKAEDNWGDIHNPITEEVLKGENFSLMRKYHNRIKRQLFRNVLQNTYRKGEEKFLLDIGSGRGGDVDKWKKFDKIVAVEPSPEHILELQRRLKLHDMENKVKIVQAGGEDTSLITRAVEDFMGRRVDVVSMMLSLTFFWKNSTMLKRLVNTIDQNLVDEGKIIFMTMDGNTVEEAFDPYFLGMKIHKLIFHQTKEDEGYATLELQPTNEVKDGQGRKVWIYIQDSIVGKEVEVGDEKEIPDPQFRNLPVIQPPSTIELIPIEHTQLPVIFTPKRVRFAPLPKLKTKKIVQEEYLVHLMDFERLLSNERTILSKDIYRADREMFLTDAEKDFSLMYSFGTYEVSGSGRFSFEYEYAQWKLFEDIKKHIKANYENADKIFPILTTFLYILSEFFGDPIEKLPLSNSIYQYFIQDLESVVLEKEKAQEIAQYVRNRINSFIDHPRFWKFADEDHIRKRGDVLSVGEAYFYIDPEKLSYFESLLKGEGSKKNGLAKIVAMLLRYFTIFNNPINLPVEFYQRLADKWGNNFILEAVTNPLSSRMHELKRGKARKEFASLFPTIDKYFGSIGFIDELNPAEFPETYTTIVYIPQMDTSMYNALGRKYQEWLEKTPESKFLRILFFVPKLLEDDEFYALSKNSKFLVYETDIMLNKPFHVFVFESSPIEGETYEELFDINFKQAYEDEQQRENFEDLPKHVRDIIVNLPQGAVLFTEKEKDPHCLYEEDMKDIITRLKAERALVLASYYGFEDEVKYILEKYDDLPNLGIGPEYAHGSALTLAAENGHANIVEILLKDGRIDPNVRINFSLSKAAAEGHADVVKLLLKDSRVDPGLNNEVLENTIKGGHTEVVKLLLEDKRSDPNVELLGHKGGPLRYAAEHGYTEIVRLLLADGRADPSARGSDALNLAAEHGHTEIVRLLLEDGRSNPSDVKSESLRRASFNGHSDIVQMLLKDKRADPNDRGDFPCPNPN